MTRDDDPDSGKAATRRFRPVFLDALNVLLVDVNGAIRPEYGRNREQAGTHFPTDLDGGRIAAAVIARALLDDARFRDAFADAASEVRGVLGGTR